MQFSADGPYAAVGLLAWWRRAHLPNWPSSSREALSFFTTAPLAAGELGKGFREFKATGEQQPSLFHKQQVFTHAGGIASFPGPLSCLFGQPIAFADVFDELPKHDDLRG